MESVEKLRDRVEAMEHRAHMIEQRLRWWRILACALLVLGLVILPLVGGTAQEQSSYERAMARRLAKALSQLPTVKIINRCTI